MIERILKKFGYLKYSELSKLLNEPKKTRVKWITIENASSKKKNFYHKLRVKDISEYIFPDFPSPYFLAPDDDKSIREKLPESAEITFIMNSGRIIKTKVAIRHLDAITKILDEELYQFYSSYRVWE
jgi:hypothetical protein